MLGLIWVGGHRLDRTGLDWTELEWTRLDGLEWTGLEWNGMDSLCDGYGLGQDQKGSPLFL